MLNNKRFPEIDQNRHFHLSFWCPFIGGPHFEVLYLVVAISKYTPKKSANVYYESILPMMQI